MSFSQNYLDTLKNQMELKVSYLQELQSLYENPLFHDMDNCTFFETYSLLIKKHFQQKEPIIYDPILIQASIDLLNQWSSSLDDFIDLPYVLYCKGFVNILKHIASRNMTTNSGKILSTAFDEKLQILDLFLKEYHEADHKISKLSGKDFSDFYNKELDPKLHQLLDQIADLSQFALENMSHINEKFMLEAIRKTLSVFNETVFDSTSKDCNREYLDSNYEVLKILLFLSDNKEDLF